MPCFDMYSYILTFIHKKMSTNTGRHFFEELIWMLLFTSFIIMVNRLDFLPCLRKVYGQAGSLPLICIGSLSLPALHWFLET